MGECSGGQKKITSGFVKVCVRRKKD